MSAFQWFGQKVAQVVYGDIDKRLLKGGQEWQRISRSLAPVKTGRLRAMETFTVDTATHTLHLHMGAPYDIFQEFGTRNMAPRPHVRPALNAIARMWGGNVSMDFAAPVGHAGLLASTGHDRAAGFAGSASPRFRPLTARQSKHVGTTLHRSITLLNRGNTKRARFHVR